MNDTERISRLIGAAMSECSSSKLGDVRGILARAMARLDEVSRETRSVPPPNNTRPNLQGMKASDAIAAIRAIDEMIESESPKTKSPERVGNLFG